MRPQGSKLVPRPQKTLEVDMPLLGSRSSGGSDDSDSPLHQGQVLPGLNVVAQMDEDFSITENLAFVERKESSQI